MDETTNAECNAIKISHSGTIQWDGSLLLLKNVGKETQRKTKKEENVG